MMRSLSTVFLVNPSEKMDRYRGIYIYYKENLPIKRRSDLEMLLAEGIVSEIVLSRKNFPLLQFIDYITCLLTISKCLYR